APYLCRALSREKRPASRPLRVVLPKREGPRESASRCALEQRVGRGGCHLDHRPGWTPAAHGRRLHEGSGQASGGRTRHGHERGTEAAVHCVWVSFRLPCLRGHSRTLGKEATPRPRHRERREDLMDGIAESIRRLDEAAASRDTSAVHDRYWT